VGEPLLRPPPVEVRTSASPAGSVQEQPAHLGGVPPDVGDQAGWNRFTLGGGHRKPEQLCDTGCDERVTLGARVDPVDASHGVTACARVGPRVEQDGAVPVRRLLDDGVRCDETAAQHARNGWGRGLHAVRSGKVYSTTVASRPTNGVTSAS
jgi:hypothetical protein